MRDRRDIIKLTILLLFMVLAHINLSSRYDSIRDTQLQKKCIQIQEGDLNAIT